MRSNLAAGIAAEAPAEAVGVAELVACVKERIAEHRRIAQHSMPPSCYAMLCYVKERLVLPQRRPDGPLHFAIDHCFPIKGQGTVLTGTVLSGSFKVGQEVEFP